MTGFTTYDTPPGMGPGGWEAPPGLRDTHGRPARVAVFSQAEGARLIEGLEGAGGYLSSRPVLEIAARLGVVAERLLDPSDDLRREAEERVPEEAGLSLHMARAVIEGMARDWTEGRLRRLLLEEFQDPRVLEEFRETPSGRLVRASGDSLAFHVGAGSVPGVGTTSLIRSLLVRSPVLLKPGSGDTTLPVLFLRALREVDPKLAAAAAVVYWEGGRPSPLGGLLMRRAERLVVYGGLEAVSYLRAGIPPTTPLVAYHHRLSLGAVAREVLADPEAAGGVARAAARALLLFERRGCVSPQCIWIEEGGALLPEDWAGLLGEALDELGSELPPPPLSASMAAEIQQLRGTAELKIASGSEGTLLAGRDLSWTVQLQRDGHPIEASNGRVVQLRTIPSLDLLPARLSSLRRVLQSVALEAPSPRRLPLAEALVRSGVSRITSFAKQPWPPPWWLHDGQPPLRALVHWAEIEH